MVALTSYVLTAGGLIGLAQASPLSAPLEARQSVAYKVYKGDGSIAQGWPGPSDWASFERIWDINIAHSPGACRWLGLTPNSDAENEVMKAAIHQAGADTGLDPRFIAVEVFQESTGCVRVVTSNSTNEGYRNPGLLQCFNGDHTCNDPGEGIPQLVPCPDEQIIGMITDGVGITTNDGLKQTVERSRATDNSRYYKGATIYNSGMLPPSGLLEHGRSNPCYASDIANRLMGWIADSSPCDRDTVGN